MSHLPWQGNEDSEFQHAARLQCTIFRHREEEVCPWSATIPSVYFASTNLDIRSTRDETEHTLIWLTNGPSLKATQPSVSLAQGQCFAYCCRIAGNWLQALVWEISWRSDSCRMSSLGITFQLCQNHLIFDRIWQCNCGQTIAYWWAKYKIMAASEERWFFWKQWKTGDSKLKPFCQRPKKGTYVDAINQCLQSRQCHCRSSQVSSGRPSIGQKHVWLMFLLTWSYTTWVFRHLHFLLHRALTIAKWGHSESGGIPNSKWNAQKVFLHVQQCVLQPHPHSSRKAGVHRKEAVELTTFNSPCQNYLIFSGNAWTIVKWGEFFVAFISMGNSQWQLWVEIFARLFSKVWQVI